VLLPRIGYIGAPFVRDAMLAAAKDFAESKVASA
jgi:hypothetical protein